MGGAAVFEALRYKLEGFGGGGGCFPLGLLGFSTGLILLAEQFRNRGLIPSRVKRLLFKISTSGLGPTQSSLQWLTKALTPGLKWPGPEAGHLRPSDTEVKNTYSSSYHMSVLSLMRSHRCASVGTGTVAPVTHKYSCTV